MAFESLSEKLQNVFKNLRGKGRLTEADVKAALKEVKMALLEADVSFKVVKQFVKVCSGKGSRTGCYERSESGTDGHQDCKRGAGQADGLRDDGDCTAARPSEITVIMMAGLQGAGKTTTTAKLAGKFKPKGRKPLLAACDVYRPAAIKQLQINGEKQGVEVFSMGDKNKPGEHCKGSHASMQRRTNLNIVYPRYRRTSSY